MTKKLLNGIKNIDWIISIISLIGVVAVTILGVFMRYFLNNPLSWLEEIQMFFIVWTVFFGGSVAFRLKGHVAIEILVDLFPKGIQKVVEAIILIITIYVLSFFTKESFNLVLQFIRDNRVTSILKIPRSIINGGVTFAGVLMIINVITVGIKDIFLENNEMEKEGR